MISQRIHNTLEEWSIEWKDRLKDWLSNILSFGIEIFSEVVAKKAATKLDPFIRRLETTGKVPPELQPLLDELKNPSGEFAGILASSAGGTLVGGALGAVLNAVFLPMAYSINSVTQNVILDEPQILALYLRGFYNLEQVAEYLKWKGRSQEEIDGLLQLIKYIPNAPEQVNWLAKEVYEPDMIERYGLLEELPNYQDTDFFKIGVDEKQFQNYWKAHWQHPALSTAYELLHRGQMTPEDLYEWYRVVEIPPYWRDKLTAASWDLPNRIELRMMARYGLVDKAFLVNQLRLVGLAEEYRDVAADMMLVMGIRTDVATRYSKGWITSDEVRTALQEAGLSEQIVERIYQWIVTNTEGERVQPERDITKAEIIRWLKKDLSRMAAAKDLLRDMGYEDWEVDFIIESNIAEATGSPEAWQEMKKLTQSYRKAMRQNYKMPSDDLVRADREVFDLTKQLQEAKEKEAPASEIKSLADALEAAKIKVVQLTKANE